MKKTKRRKNRKKEDLTSGLGGGKQKMKESMKNKLCAGQFGRVVFFQKNAAFRTVPFILRIFSKTNTIKMEPYNATLKSIF